jgi:hypothetical protein
MDTEHQIPIWFFIGAMLVVYGVLIFGAGVYGWVYPPEHRVTLWQYHADVWWSILMVIVGAIYCARFHPWRTQP